ncbi:hypothetical protein [Paenibacillus thalictri]|uniref:Uncharacterized protein n=1 Tax=Paenibacillus thalictri TaxID=2527873 RepID=A0A4Q9DHD5_9BACL|nr:hypothetical protein [Paenibacillus thalictri]TBL70263.1 hypothetical protein EYB31_33635 [Paenibacillus thalictri]
MKSYKQLIQDQLEKVKTTANQLTSSRQDDEKYTLELDSYTFQKLKSAADEGQTTVQAVVDHMIEQFLAQVSPEPAGHISDERKEQNPLLLLNGICGRGHY